MCKKTVRLLSIVLCAFMVILMMAGCQGNKGSTETTQANATTTQAAASESVVEKSTFPDVLKVTRCLYFGDASDSPDLKQDFMKAFKEKTGVNLEITYPPRSEYMEKINLMVTSGELKGIVNFFSPSDIVQAIENGTIEPLDDYLKDNANWNSMPDEYKDLYKINGKIYGIPAGYDGSFFTRSFRQDWLDNLGMKVPSTVDELFDVARAFTENDPDKNDKKDTLGLTSSSFWNLQDIFQAFDARLNNIGECSIVWDPVPGIWIDSMLKPEMADALAYVKKLYDAGYLDKEFFTDKGANMREKLWTGRAGSSFYWVLHAYRQAATEMKASIPQAKWVEVPALKGKRTEQLNNRVMGGLLYVLVKGTQQPKETVNTFIDKFLFDKDIHIMARCGIEGKTYKMVDNRITILKDPNTGKPFLTPGLTGEMPAFNRFTIPWCYDGTEEEIQTSLNYITIEKNMSDTGNSQNLLFNVNGAAYDSPGSSEYAVKKADIVKVFEEAMSKAILGEKTIDQALKDYREKMKALGADKVLQEANASIGKTANQTY